MDGARMVMGMLLPLGFFCGRLDGAVFVLLVGRDRGCAGSKDGSTGVDVFEVLPFGVWLVVWDCIIGRPPVSTDSAGFASDPSRLVWFMGPGIRDASSFSISLPCVSMPITLPLGIAGSTWPGVSLAAGWPSKGLSTPRPALERASPRVDPGPGNVLSFATRVDAEDEGLIRPLFDCVAFCGVREDCGRLAMEGPGLFAFRGALNVPTRGDGASAGDSAEAPAGFLVVR